MSRPNVVLIMTDQQRADVSAREGFPLDTTPCLDHLAREGVWFDRGYTSAPVCAPARVSLHTGRYVSAHRAHSNWNGEDAVFTQDLFGLFRESGYATALVGKNHSQMWPSAGDYWLAAHHDRIEEEDPSERAQRFTEFLRGLHSHMSIEPTPFPLECQMPCRLVTSAQDWVRSVADKPFLLWLSFPEPHNPYQAPEPYYSIFPPEKLPPVRADETALAAKGFKFQWCRQSLDRAFPGFAGHLPRARSNYLGMLRLIDDQVRRFVEFLEAEGLRENTIIVFTSDHGDFVGEYGLLRKGPEVPECLTRIPLQFVGPGIVARPEAHPAHVSIVDVMPTLCEAIGAELPDGVQGRSLWPLLTGKDYPADEFRSAYVEQGVGGLHYTPDDSFDPREDGFQPADGQTWGAFDELNSRTQSGTMRMVRKGDWKLIFDMQGRGQLYDLAQDPAEIEDLYGQPEHAAIQNDMLAELLAWALRVPGPLPAPGPRYVLKKDPRNYSSPYRQT